VNDLADLAELDHELGRVGGTTSRSGCVWMRIRVSFFYRFRGRPSRASTASATRVSSLRSRRCGCSCGTSRKKSGSPSDSVGLVQLTALASMRARVYFARALWPRQDERVGKPLGADRLAQMGDGLRVAEKVLKSPRLSLLHWRNARPFPCRFGTGSRWIAGYRRVPIEDYGLTSMTMEPIPAPPAYRDAPAGFHQA